MYFSYHRINHFFSFKTDAASFDFGANFFGRLVGQNVGMSDCVVGLAAASDGVVVVDADAVEVDVAVAAVVALASDAPFPRAAKN